MGRLSRTSSKRAIGQKYIEFKIKTTTVPSVQETKTDQSEEEVVKIQDQADSKEKLVL